METKPTRRQEAVFSVLERAPGPLTVAETLEQAREVVPGLGVATVYRALRWLQKREMIRAVQLPLDEVRYEASDLEHHHHFHCRECERVFDIDVCPFRSSPPPVLSGGFRLEKHDITMYGVCPECEALLAVSSA